MHCVSVFLSWSVQCKNHVDIVGGPDRPLPDKAPQDAAAASATGTRVGELAAVSTTASNLYSRLSAALVERGYVVQFDHQVSGCLYILSILRENLANLNEQIDSLKVGSRDMVAQVRTTCNIEL